MNKLEQMEIMSDRLSEKCADYPNCNRCGLKETEDDFCCYTVNINDYDKLKEHCEIMGIDISDLTGKVSEDKTPKEEPKVFTVQDIKPGYLLLVDRGTIKSLMIGLPIRDNEIGFYVIEEGGAIGMHLFTLDDILPDFTTKRTGHKIEKIYGYITTNHDVFDQEYRPVLWAKSNKEYHIYENGQKISLKPNLNTYFDNKDDGDVFITDKASYLDVHEVRYISIKRENLKAVIEALQEIQKLYKESEEK